jgi:hypothetical protein
MVKYSLTLGTESSNVISANLYPPIRLENDGNKRWYIGLYSFSAFNTFPNISVADNNNHFLFSISGTNYDFQLLQGQYDIDLFSSAISVLLVNNNLPANTFLFSGDTASQRVLLQINNINATVLWLNMPELASLCGFTSNSSVLVSGQTVIASNSANFNKISSLLVLCDACSGQYTNSISNGNTNQAQTSQVLANVNISSNIGYQFLYAPSVLIFVDCNAYSIDQIRLRVVDQLSRDIINNDPISITMIITDEP